MRILRRIWSVVSVLVPAFHEGLNKAVAICVSLGMVLMFIGIAAGQKMVTLDASLVGWVTGSGALLTIGALLSSYYVAFRKVERERDEARQKLVESEKGAEELFNAAKGWQALYDSTEPARRWDATMRQHEATTLAVHPFEQLERDIIVELEEIRELTDRLNAQPAPLVERRRSLAAIVQTQKRRDNPPLDERQVIGLFARDRLPEIISLRDKAAKIQIQTGVLDACIPQPTSLDGIAKIVAALTAIQRCCESRGNEIRQSASDSQEPQSR